MNEPEQVVRRYPDALVRGDPEIVRHSFAQDAVWMIQGELPIAGPWRGRDHIVDDFLAEVGGALYAPGSVEFEFPTLLGEGDTVVMEWRVRALTPRGGEYSNVCCGLFVVRDDRIAEVREYLDAAYAQRTLFADAAA